MFKNLYFLLLGSLFVLAGCQEASLLPANIRVKINETKPSITKVVVQNDQLIITGKNLSDVTIAKIEGSTNHNFQIESKSENQLILNAKSALSLLVGETFNLIVGNAKADATFPISFELQNGQVTAAKLHHMGASAGQYLRFNGTTWAPASISSSQVFAGAYDASTNSPDIETIGGTAGTYYIVSVGGTHNFSSGSITFDVGDWVIFNGSDWEKLAVGANTVSAFNGRTGLIVPAANDYSWSMLTKTGGKLTGSKVSEIADVNVVGIQDGDILQWNQTSSTWEVNAVPAPTITAGSITSTQLANSAVDSNKIVDGTITNTDISASAGIDQSKINGLTGVLNGKEASLPSGGTAAHYLNGTKTWADFATSFLGTQLSGYVTGVAGPISPLDTINQALGKLEARDSAISAAQSNYVLLNGSVPMTGDLQMSNNQITGLGAPGADTDAATKKYVDDEIANASLGGGSSQWTTTGANISYSTGNVGIGIATPTAPLHIKKAGIEAGIDLESDTESSNITLRSTSTGVDYQIISDPMGRFVIADLNTENMRMTILNNGNVGIGNNDPSERLAVTGNIALTGKVLLKSDNANYVELKAPIGLGSTYTLSFPLNDGSANQVLTTDGSGNLSWTTPAGGAPTGAAGGELSGTYPNPTIANGLSVTKLSDGTIDNTEFGYLNGATSNIQTQLNAKEGALPAGGVAGDYLRGNKTWSNFSTDVQASVIGTFTPVTGSQVSALDSILNALQKLQGQINDLVSDLSDSITWTKNGTDIEYNAGNVGIGRTPAAKLDVNGGIRPGSETSVTTCGLGAANGEGTQRYNYTTHRMEYCDGGAWVAMNGKSDYGTLTITGAANCRWDLTSSSWNKYATDTDCPNPVLTGTALAPTEGKIPAIRFASLPAGEYEVHLNAYSMYAVNDGFCMYRLTDGTNFSGMSNSDGYYLLELNFLVGRFRYTTDQTNITFYLEARSTTTPTETCRTDNSVVGQDKIQIWVNRL